METDYLDQIASYNTRKAQPIAKKCALLVIDMQEFFRSFTPDIIDNVLMLIEGFRANEIPIIFTRHGHKNLKEDGGLLAIWWENHVMYGSPEWELLEEIHVKKGDIVLDKNRYSAFWGTGLSERLRSKNVDEVVITGVMTNCCCETTARDAFMRDFNVFFVSDATSTENVDLHLASLKNLAFGFAYIVNTEFLCRTLSNTG
ncbi:MAG: isochorismatase family protein [Methanotrichaceae archaeon]|nr:isochorismatase family protein [Methanotrichaceae archaeon]